MFIRNEDNMPTRLVLIGLLVSFTFATALPQDLQVGVSDNVQILLVDQSGKRTGFDQSTGQTTVEIQNSHCYTEGVGYIGDEEKVETENSNFIDIDDSPTEGPYSLTVFGVYGGKYHLRITRGIQNRYVLNQERFVGKGLSEEFALSFTGANVGILVKSVKVNSLREDIQAIFTTGDIGDEHFFNELKKEVDRFEVALITPDTLKAVKTLENFQETITKEYEKGIQQSHNRYIRPAAWKVLCDDSQSLIDRLSKGAKKERG
jgi:hypothetical protein